LHSILKRKGLQARSNYPGVLNMVTINCINVRYAIAMLTSFTSSMIPLSPMFRDSSRPILGIQMLLLPLIMSSTDLANSILKPSTRSLQIVEINISNIIHNAKTIPLAPITVLGVFNSTTLTTTESSSSTATFGNIVGLGRRPNTIHAKTVRIIVACKRYIENEMLPRKTRWRFESKCCNAGENNIEVISRKAPIVQ